MAFEIHTKIDINAPAEKIWNILVDTGAYPSWNPLVTSLEGKLAIGEKLTAKLPGMTFTPTVMSYQKNAEFSWLGHLFVRGLFDGHHKFGIESHGNGTCTFYHSENFKGILLPLFKKMLVEKTIPGFEEMNEALKERAES